MRYRLILWDFDGTLADTFGCVLLIYNRLADRHGFRRIERPEEVRTLTLVSFLRAYNISVLKVPTLVRQVLAAQRGEVERVRLFPDLADVLGGLHRAGCRMSIVSSNAEANIRACLRVNQVEGLFDAVVGYRRLLGKGRALTRLLKAQGLAPRDAVYVGDELRDIEAARDAGVDVAAVTWGYQAKELLAGSAPNYLVEHPADLLRTFAAPR